MDLNSDDDEEEEEDVSAEEPELEPAAQAHLARQEAEEAAPAALHLERRGFSSTSQPACSQAPSWRCRLELRLVVVVDNFKFAWPGSCSGCSADYPIIQTISSKRYHPNDLI